MTPSLCWHLSFSHFRVEPATFSSNYTAQFPCRKSEFRFPIPKVVVCSFCVDSTCQKTGFTMKRHYWERVVSATVSPTSVPMVGYGIAYHDGEFTEWSEPVLGILAEVIETYLLRSFDGSPRDEPKLPPSAKNLEREGWEFHSRFTKMRYILQCDNQPDAGGDMDGEETMFIPASLGKPTQEAIDYVKENLKRLSLTRSSVSKPTRGSQ